MLTVEPRPLLGKLNATCTRALEAGAAKCVSNRHYEVTVEHVLLSLLEDPDSDITSLLEHFKIDARQLQQTVQRQVGELRSGNPGKPVFGQLLLEWIQDAWLYASTELNEGSLRSGALFVRLVVAPSRYMPTELPALMNVPRDRLRQELPVLAATSGEAAETKKAQSPVSAAAMAGGGEGVLDRFTSDLTLAAREDRIDPVLGREREIRQMIQILVRRRKNNPIVIGEAGVGKTALVEGLALKIAAGQVPEQLAKVKLLSLDMGSLQAGAGVKGEFENRLKSVIAQVKASEVPIILFIDEVHTLIGAGGQQAGDAANLLKPALARGELRTIGATTYAEFKRYIEKDPALERRFQPVRVEEPDLETAIGMLQGVADKFSGSHGVFVRDEAVRAAVELSSRYISGRQLPDKAVDLIDTAAAYVKLLRAAPPAALEYAEAERAMVKKQLDAHHNDQRAGVVVGEAVIAGIRARLGELDDKVGGLARKLEEQRLIVKQIDDLRLQLVGEGEKASTTLRGKLTELLAKLSAIPAEERLVAADVDAQVIANIVSDWTGVPVGNMVKDEIDAILNLAERLGERVRGQDGALEAIARELRAARAGLKPPQTPLGVFLLVGPSGVGKTETALGLADALFGGERFMVTVNMSEFQERHTVSRLIGSPPGYVGYGEGGVLTEAVRHRPYSVVLLDEVEKADSEVMNIFYQVFDKGMLADGEGRVIDFRNTVVVMTSNLATDLITSAAPPDAEPPAFEDLVQLVKPTLSAYFKPALLARMTVLPYLPIARGALKAIAELKLGALKERAREAHGVELSISPELLESIVERCQEVESGARNIDHILRGSVLPVVSRELLSLLATSGSVARLHVGLDAQGNVTCGVPA